MIPSHNQHILCHNLSKSNCIPNYVKIMTCIFNFLSQYFKKVNFLDNEPKFWLMAPSFWQCFLFLSWVFLAGMGFHSPPWKINKFMSWKKNASKATAAAVRGCSLNFLSWGFKCYFFPPELSCFLMFSHLFRYFGHELLLMRCSGTACGLDKYTEMSVNKRLDTQRNKNKKEMRTQGKSYRTYFPWEQ